MKWARIGKWDTVKTINMDVNALQWYLHEKGTPPMTPPITNNHENLLFIVEMEMYVYYPLQTIEVNGITSADRYMDIQTLWFV